MTKPDLSTLASLLERVREAERPTEELDARILCALGAEAGAYVEQSRINGAWCVYTANGRLWEKRGDWWRRDGWPVTASLDAALALVERALPASGVCAHAVDLLSQALEDMLVQGWKPNQALGSQVARYLLAALLTALIQQAEADGPGRDR